MRNVSHISLSTCTRREDRRDRSSSLSTHISLPSAEPDICDDIDCLDSEKKEREFDLRFRNGKAFVRSPSFYFLSHPLSEHLYLQVLWHRNTCIYRIKCAIIAPDEEISSWC